MTIRSMSVMAAAAVFAALLVAAPPASATATAIEVSLDGLDLLVKGHPGGGPGDIIIRRSGSDLTVLVDPDSGGVAQLWSTDLDCSPASGVDAMQVTCSLPLSTGKPTVTVDMKESTIDGDERPFVVQGVSATFYGSSLGDYFEIQGESSRMFGAGGEDTLMGGASADTIEGGADDDYIEGGGGSDTIASGSGTDEIEAEDKAADAIDCGDFVGAATDPDSVTFDKGLDKLSNCLNYNSATKPSNTSPPTVAKSPVVGRPSLAAVGTWQGGGSMTYRYRWFSCPNRSVIPDPVKDCQIVVDWTSDAAALTYVPRSTDARRRLIFMVEATNEAGRAEARSALTIPVKGGPAITKPANTVKPSIPSPVWVGKEILGNPGTWTGDDITYSYTWKVCPKLSTPLHECDEPSGAWDMERFTAGPADKNKYLALMVTAKNSAGQGMAASNRQLIELVTAPGPPNDLTWKQITPTEIELAWALPTQQGGRPVSEYRIEYFADSGNWVSDQSGAYLKLATVFANSVRVTVQSVPVAQYYFRIAAVNVWGVGEWAYLSPVSTSPPPAPTKIYAERDGSRGARVSWDQASYTSPSKTDFANSGGASGIIEWQVDYRSTPLDLDYESWSDWGTLGTYNVPAIDVTQLGEKLRYQFRVRARNVTDWGPWAEGPYVNIDDRTAPSEVRNVSVKTVGDKNIPMLSGYGGQLDVSWDPPSDDGDPGNASLSYTATAIPGGQSCSVNNRFTRTRESCVINGLNDGDSYVITITTRNGAAGVSTVTTAGTFVPYGAPMAPAFVGKPVYAKKGKTSSATISWSWPTDTGGFTAPNYTMEVLVSTGVGSQGARKYEVIGEFDSSSTGCDITDLAPGRQKTIYIRVATPRAKGAIASITLQPPK